MKQMQTLCQLLVWGWPLFREIWKNYFFFWKAQIG